MKKTYCLLIFALLLSNVALAASKGSERPKGLIGKLCSWLYPRMTGNRAGQTTTGEQAGGARATPALFQSFVRNEAKQLGELTETELRLLERLQKLSSDDTHTLAMLQQYSGPRDRFPGLLEWNVAKLEAANGNPNDFELEQWVTLPGFEDVQAAWARHHEAGWRACIDERSIKRESASAQVLPEQHRIAFRSAPSDEPLPLTAAEEIYHIDALETVRRNDKQLRWWVREGLGEVVFADFLKDVDQHTRYHWLFLRVFDEKLKQLPEKEIEKAVVFLIERDAMARKLNLYRQLVKTHPEFRTQVWDEIAASQYPIARMSGILNRQARFGLNPKFVENLGEHLLDDLIRGVGGETLEEHGRRLAREEQLEPLSYPSLAEARRATPPVLANRGESVSILSDRDYIEPRAAEMSNEEAERLRDYLREPWFSDPSAVQHHWEESQGIAYYSPHRNVMLAHDSHHLGILILDAYDKLHGTRYAVDAVIHATKSLRPNKRAGDYASDFWTFDRIVMEAVAPRSGTARVPDALKNYFQALVDCHVLRAVVSDDDYPNRLSVALATARNLAPENRPSPAHVLMLLNTTISTHEGAAIVARNYEQFNQRAWAKGAASAGREYFTAIGDEPHAKFYADAEARLQEGMDKYQRDQKAGH